ncbi:MAG: sulfotransferase family 2 domain-containing protein [Methyloceanibacter sp.]|uniref:sulfotransferase family 2 domain-containing protein n=1 Tax=Methyloceanibacter sp. TaxID=1965321 RepID=UPI003D9BEC41
MIISHEHKFIFLKTKKTAGTAIEAALSELCGPSDVITPYREESEMDRKGLGPQNYRIEHPLKPKRPLWRKLLGRPERYYHHSVGFYEHMPASRVRDYVGEEVWRSYFKFAFDRNPWDRQVSWYLYKTKTKRFRPSFERFMQDRRHAFVTNYAIYTIDGGLAVDFVGRYENLQDELAKALDLAGVGRHLEVPRTNVTPDKDQARDYRSYYSDATRERVAEWYAPEIALLHYGF